MWAERIDLLGLHDEGRACMASDTLNPGLVLLFGTTDALEASDAPAALVRAYPGAIHVGCSSGTLVDGATLVNEGLVAMAVGFDRTGLRLVTQPLMGAAGSRAAGERIGAALAAPDLVGVFVLSEGLGVNGGALVDGLRKTIGPNVVISGGMAGDGPRFEETRIYVGGNCVKNLVAAVGFYGPAIRIAHGCAGGWDPFGPHRSVTRSSGAVLHELDGKPVLDLYEHYLGEEAEDLPASGLLYPLKIWDPARPEDAVVRTLLAIDRDTGSITFAGDIPEGWSARLMRGALDNLTDGAIEAADHARRSAALSGLEPGLCLFVSCVGRRLAMGQRTEDELDAVRASIGTATPVTGFYSYGEIAPHNRSGVCGFHNQTVTLTLLAETD